MIHRLNNIPLDEIDYKDELNTIKYLAESNGYDRTIVSKLLHKTQNKQQTKTENNKFITLTYINKQTEKIAHKFKKQDTESLTKLLTKQNTHYQNACPKHKTNSIYPVYIN